MVDKYVISAVSGRKIKVGSAAYKALTPSQKAKSVKVPSPKSSEVAKKSSTKKVKKVSTKKSSEAKKVATKKPKAKSTSKKSSGRPTIVQLRAKAREAGVKVPANLKGEELRGFLEGALAEAGVKIPSPKKSSPTKTPAIQEEKKSTKQEALCKCPPAFEESKNHRAAYWVYSECTKVCSGNRVTKIVANSHKAAVFPILSFVANESGYKLSDKKFWEALGENLGAEWKGSVDATLGLDKSESAGSRWIRGMMSPFTVASEEAPVAMTFIEERTFVVVLSTPETDEIMKFFARGSAYESPKTPKALTPQKMPSPQKETKSWVQWLFS